MPLFMFLFFFIFSFHPANQQKRTERVSERTTIAMFIKDGPSRSLLFNHRVKWV